MMAERKRKVKWSLNPRGKAWSENSNKFGQKLMEKMGWSEGKGLGANEDGMTNHIRVAYKNDTQGMGYKDRDDQWAEHESNFTQLLSTLAGPNDENKTKIDVNKIESLEKKSEASKARLHYRKFTRGKDVSRYSAKDLANIFGKKHLDELTIPQSGKEEITDEKENGEDKSFGVVTHNGGNMLDYFKNKLPNFKKTFPKSAPETSKDDSESDIERPSFGFGFGKSEDKKEITEVQPKIVENKFKKNTKNSMPDPTDNFRKTCFGLGYDRYNGDDSKPKSKFTSFVKASDTNERKEPLIFGIKKALNTKDQNSSETEKPTLNKIHTSSFMAFIKGGVLNNKSKEDDVVVEKEHKNKKRKRKNDENIADNDLNGTNSDLGNETLCPNRKDSKNNASFVENDVCDENVEKRKKKKDKSKNKITADEEKNGAISNDELIDNSIKTKKKKNKTSKDVDGTIDNSNVNEDIPSKKGKKRKSDSEFDVAFTPMKKKFKNFEDLHSLQGDEKITETPKEIKKKKKVKKEDSIEENGLTNPAFDPMYNDVKVSKHHLDPIREETENLADSPIGSRTETLEETSCQGGHEKKNKKKKSKSIESIQSVCEEENSTEKPEKKRKKSKSVNGMEIPTAEDTSIVETPDKKSKKKKSKGIDNPCLDIASIDESVEPINDLEVSQTEEKKKSKKSKKKTENISNGIENTAFDENSTMNESVQQIENKYEVKEKKKKRKEVEDITLDDSMTSEKKKKKKKNNLNEIDQESEKSRSEEPLKIKKKKRNETFSIENPCFNGDDSLIKSEVTPNKYEVKREKKDKNLGISNPGLDLTSPPPKETHQNGTIEDDLPVMDDGLMLNVVCTPIIKKENDKKLQRRKSVRFSEINQSILINNMDSPADLRKNCREGLDNAAYDQFGNRIEENIDTLSKQLDDYQAQVENDLNEAKMEVMVGETSDPNGENEILPSGEVKLRLKYAKFGRQPPWMKRTNSMSPKGSYRHLIKGDITLAFKNTNMHEIKGYNEHLKTSCT